MSELPRLLVIMGSGETSPTMVPVHRSLLARLGPPPVPAVMLDTPAAFQENVGQLGERVVDFFHTRLQQELTVLAVGGDVPRAGATGATALARLAEARYVFAGPGSPTYALDQWLASAVPELLADKLRRGGCVTFASAAAVTLGVVTLPVYEIYKVGQAPFWRPGLDLLAASGLSAAVLPHFDNSDGGDHDTRFCFVGERRLRALEEQLPPGAFILGVDEHTAAVFDLAAGMVTVTGRGGLTVRRGEFAERFPDGASLPFRTLAQMAEGLGRAVRAGAVGRNESIAEPSQADLSARNTDGAFLIDEVAALDSDFQAAVDRRDIPGAVAVALALEARIQALGGEALPESASAWTYLQAMLVRLGEAAGAGNVDRRAVLAPLVETLLVARQQARAEQQWAMADLLRDALATGGITLADSPDGTEWTLADA
jgi:cyanophycinase-like exopeptidase